MKVLVVSLHPVTGHSLEYKRNPKPLGPIHLVHIQYQHYLIHRSHKMTTFVVANGVLNIVLIILFTKQKHKQETHKNSYAFFRDSLQFLLRGQTNLYCFIFLNNDVAITLDNLSTV